MDSTLYRIWKDHEERSKAYPDSHVLHHIVQRYVASQYTSFSADYYCADEYNANLCAQLILKGDKQASCSLEYWYSRRREAMPVVGHFASRLLIGMANQFVSLKLPLFLRVRTTK